MLDSETLQATATPTPDERVLRFVESELRQSGRLHGFWAMAFVRELRMHGLTAAERAGLRLVLALYGERVDPAAHEVLREAIVHA